MDVQQAIRTKRAVRQFQDMPLPDEGMLAILNAGRRAQSSRNTQPWHFIAIRDGATLQQLSELAVYGSHLAGAALGVCILTPDPSERQSIMFDAGQAAAYMQLAAWELGVGSCIASVQHHEQARVLLGFPSNLHLSMAISFGYPADPAVLTKPPQKGGRKPLEETVHWERW